MKYTEELMWILDKKDVKLNTLEMQEKVFQENIAFVHSLGLKCDCVGWSKLDLGCPGTEEILSAIEAFCKEKGWEARGWYTRRYAEAESEWYAIRFADTKDGFFSDRQEVMAENGKTVEICTVKAYQELAVSPKGWCDYRLVPERLRTACIQLGMEDVAFCWARDKGKYEASQYFHIYPRHSVAHLAKNHRFCYSTKGLHKLDPFQTQRMENLGGALPRLAKVFSELHIDLPNCYLAAELPASGFAGAYIPWTRLDFGEQAILVHKETAAALIRQKGLTASMLMPVPVLDVFPSGYDVLNTEHQSPPAPEVRESLYREYEKIKSKPRPVRLVSEKEALKQMRKAKKERKEEFQKGYPKAKADEIRETAYGPLVPYYLIANGGYLSDEYALLPYARAVGENKDFHKRLDAEELLEEKPQGIVFANCPDGDVVLLCANGTVIRFSHEAPEEGNQWPSLPQFIVDAIQDCE